MGKEEALPMGENTGVGRSAGERSHCQIGRLPAKSSSCAEPAKEIVDGLLLCERHALGAKLEGQIGCWEEMLFHIDLWSEEASRQDRTQIVELLDTERAKATVALERVYEDLDTLRRGEIPGGDVTPAGGRVFRRAPLLLLPPEAARPLSRGLRRLRRR